MLGQVACHEKSNEITAIPELLDLLDVRGKIVTTDAMGAQKQIAQKVRDGGGDYVFLIKGSAGNIHQDVGIAVCRVPASALAWTDLRLVRDAGDRSRP